MAAAVALLCVPCLSAGGDDPVPAPVKVEIVREGGRYVLLRGGQEYRIKGAGTGFGGVAALAVHGGNSFRTWSGSSATNPTCISRIRRCSMPSTISRR
jgi:hypothetical protein